MNNGTPVLRNRGAFMLRRGGVEKSVALHGEKVYTVIINVFQ